MVEIDVSSSSAGETVLFAGANIRYATASYQGNWKYNINIRYAVLPHNGEPVHVAVARSILNLVPPSVREAMLGGA